MIASGLFYFEIFVPNLQTHLDGSSYVLSIKRKTFLSKNRFLFLIVALMPRKPKTQSISGNEILELRKLAERYNCRIFYTMISQKEHRHLYFGSPDRR